ncbi:MAG TPA: Flp pilus assembly protein CpaB [Acidimicrobiia bacterium]|jgi:Flp pilus assembly protein CpaB
MLARSPRALALWAGALAVAAGTATLVASDLAALHRRAQSLGEERGAVVATRALHLGEPVRPSDVRTRAIHASQLPPGVLNDVRDVAGRVVVVAVVRGGFVARANLAPLHRHGLDGALPPGTRAMRVVVRDTLRPRIGSAVDVLASFDPSIGADGLPTTGEGRAALVAPGVTVLGVEAVHTAEGDAFGVTVLVSPRQARDLAFASTHGRLALALVPPEDAHEF